MDPAFATTSATTTTTLPGPNLLPVFNILSPERGISVLRDIVAPFFERILHGVAPFSLFFSLLLLVGIVYCTLRINRIRAEERAFYKGAVEKAKAAAVGSVGHNPKWERAVAHLESENPSDWRLAILEADIMLDEMVAGMALLGDNLGERLRNVERSDFLTIDRAWEAHKVRNQIAHEGADFLLSEREAKRVLALYRDVFNEFHYI